MNGCGNKQLIVPEINKEHLVQMHILNIYTLLLQQIEPVGKRSTGHPKKRGKDQFLEEY
jgi:hypothetical protein